MLYPIELRERRIESYRAAAGIAMRANPKTNPNEPNAVAAKPRFWRAQAGLTGLNPIPKRANEPNGGQGCSRVSPAVDWSIDRRPALFMTERFTFSRSRRLSGRRAFSRVFEGKTRRSRGPLTVYALSNAVGHPRLGLSVSRRVGNAVKRNRIKRLLREAFRLSQHDLPGAYDYVIVVRAHPPLGLPEYCAILLDLARRLNDQYEGKEQS